MLRKSNLQRQEPIVEVQSNEQFEPGFSTVLPAFMPALPEIVFLTTYPPRECGLASYSQDLVDALNNKFEQSFDVQICALESDVRGYVYPDNPKYILNTTAKNAFAKLAFRFNRNANMGLLVIQHEFGLFASCENEFEQFLRDVNKPIVLVFHTVLPKPGVGLRFKVREMVSRSGMVVVMTNSAFHILMQDYGIAKEKLKVIAHGTHLVTHLNRDLLKRRFDLQGKKVLATFGLLSAGKSIETTLDALPRIALMHPDVLFLIIGKTHPVVALSDGEKYREFLEEKVRTLQLHNHVRFINNYLDLPELLEYLQLTDIYLFTSNNPDQAVSGTFSYAISCGCPVISTPIPHAREVLNQDTGSIVDFGSSVQLADHAIKLLDDELLRREMGLRGLHKMASTAWENAAIAHANAFAAVSQKHLSLNYKLPRIDLQHIKKMTNNFGMIQFATINHPDLNSGYTLDDNARALVAMCQYYEVSEDVMALGFIHTYFRFIQFCMQPDGSFLNYVNQKKEFTAQNKLENLEDSNGRAVWALGYLISLRSKLPRSLLESAIKALEQTHLRRSEMHSTRAMAFAIKGLYYANLQNPKLENLDRIEILADKMVQMYKHETRENWHWFECYLTYGNSLLPEALLCAWLCTGKLAYKEIAKQSFDFLLSKIFKNDRIQVISNKGWLFRDEHFSNPVGGEQPIDVAYTIMALEKFYTVFRSMDYRRKLDTAFNWFLGSNHLNQIIYNPCTGGCYDGLEENCVNLNQGAESTLSYLMARLSMETVFRRENTSTFQRNSGFQFGATDS